MKRGGIIKNIQKKCKKLLTNSKRLDIILFVATGCGSAWLERLVWDQEVAGSNPVTPIDTKEY